MPDTCACALGSKDFALKINCERPCENEVLVLPICLSHHWYLVVCARKQMVIMGRSGRSGVKRTADDFVILDWLNNGSSDWIISFEGDAQPNDDTVNCGVYLLWNLDQYLRILLLSLAGVEDPPSFEHLDSVSQLRQFRASIAQELVLLAGLIL